MECPYCNSELKYVDYYYSGRPESFHGTAGCGLHYPSTMKKLGDIYQCRNHEFFEDLDVASEYKDQNNIEGPVEDIRCDSGNFNGFFYTTEYQSDLQEGYPC